MLKHIEISEKDTLFPFLFDIGVLVSLDMAVVYFF